MNINWLKTDSKTVHILKEDPDLDNFTKCEKIIDEKRVEESGEERLLEELQTKINNSDEYDSLCTECSASLEMEY